MKDTVWSIILSYLGFLYENHTVEYQNTLFIPGRNLKKNEVLLGVPFEIYMIKKYTGV